FEEDNWAGPAKTEPPPVVDAEGRVLPPGRFPKGRPGVASGAPVYGQPGFVPPRVMPNYGPLDYVRPDTTRLPPAIDDWHFCGYGSRRLTGPPLAPNPLNPNEQREPPEPVGVAAWNDQGAPSKAAGEILTD